MLLANSPVLLRHANDCETLYIFYVITYPELLGICCKAFFNLFHYFCKFQQAAQIEIKDLETSF